jgi:hypothetical protein
MCFCSISSELSGYIVGIDDVVQRHRMDNRGSYQLHLAMDWQEPRKTGRRCGGWTPVTSGLRHMHDNITCIMCEEA